MTASTITGWGHEVPDNVVTNDDMAQRVDTSDAWIRERSGIRERRHATDGETTATMSIACATRALERAGVAPAEVDLVLVASSSPDYLTPPVSSQVQEGIGATRAGAMQLTVGCTGFVYALITAQQFISTGACRTVLVVGAELTSRWMNYNDRSTCVLFGDGAGAVVVQATEADGCGLRGHVLGSDGSGAEHLIIPVGGVAQPTTEATLAQEKGGLRMNGREVFKFATRVLGTSLQQALGKADLTVDDIDLLVPHQANARIIDLAAREVGVPLEKVVVNVDRYGNTSAASVPLALSEAFDAGRVAPGDTLALVAFGAGLTWAAAIYRMGPAPLPV